MKLIKLIALSFIFLLGSSFSYNNMVHDIHVTKCNIDFSEGESSLQITMHIYLDDLEAAINKGGVEETLFLCTEKEHKDGNKYIKEYFEKMFKLEVNGEAVTYNFLGKESAKDIMAGWFYLEVEGVKELTDLKVNYGILTDVHSDQQNVIRIKGPKKAEGYFLLDSKKTEASTSF